jgi:hypothetical protein
VAQSKLLLERPIKGLVERGAIFLAMEQAAEEYRARHAD